MLMKAPLRKKKGKREGFPEDGARCAMAAQCAVAHGTHIRVGGLYLPSLADESIRGGGGGGVDDGCLCGFRFPFSRVRDGHCGSFRR